MNHGPSPIRREDIPLAGKAYWRSLDELADTPAFRDWVEQKFPRSMRNFSTAGSTAGDSFT